MNVVAAQQSQLSEQVMTWLCSKNEWFSKVICQEEVSNWQVLVAHGAAVVALAIIGIGGVL